MPLIEMRFPPAGHAADAGLPGADQRPHVRDPAAARRARRRGRQGGRRPDAGRPGDDPLHRRLRRGPRRPALPDARGARRRLRRPLLRRRRGHHPRRARLAEPAERVHRGALPVPWSSRSSLADGLRRRRGSSAAGSATRSTSGCSRTATSCPSRTGRSWPAGACEGGLAGQPFQVVIDPGGPNEREVDALADAEPVKAGEVIRIRTTGGGGWGDPLERDPALVVRDVVWRKVSPGGGAGRLRRGAHRLARRRRRSATTPTRPPPSGPAGPAADRGVLRPRPGLRPRSPAGRRTPRSTY